MKRVPGIYRKDLFIVGEDLGVVVGLSGETNVLEDHYAIWRRH